MAESGEGHIDEELIQNLLQSHLERIEAAAHRVLGSAYHHYLDDICQEVRLSLWHALEKGQQIHSWQAFIYHCAHRRSLDLLRHNRRRSRHEIPFAELHNENPVVTGTHPLSAYSESPQSGNLAIALEEELTQLPPVVRLTVLLRKGEGYTRDEVSRIMQCSKATVDHRLHLGLTHLRNGLKRRGLHIRM